MSGYFTDEVKRIVTIDGKQWLVTLGFSTIPFKPHGAQVSYDPPSGTGQVRAATPDAAARAATRFADWSAWSSDSRCSALP